MESRLIAQQNLEEERYAAFARERRSEQERELSEMDSEHEKRLDSKAYRSMPDPFPAWDSVNSA